MLGVALGTAVSDGLVVRGYIRNTTYFTSNFGILYLSSTTPGILDINQPTGLGDIVRVAGYLISAANDIIYFNPSPDWIELG